MLKKARLNKKYTQNFLSKKTGISQSYISKLENSNKHSPTIREILLLSKALDICPLCLSGWFMLKDSTINDSKYIKHIENYINSCNI